MISPRVMASHDWTAESVSKFDEDGIQTSVEDCQRCSAKRNRLVERDVQTLTILKDIIGSTVLEYLAYCPKTPDFTHMGSEWLSDK